MKYTPTIGLEIHAELKTKSKMFCSCKNDPIENKPNTNICPICMGHPGTLPVPNETAIHMVLKAGLALDCKLAEFSKFDRKSYFYPDLPKGYQISQYDLPLCEHGKLHIGERDIRITRIHLEEDTARSQHTEDTDYSLVDFNRAGVPLMELVTEPDITTAKEAAAFAQELQMILRYLNISDADMEKGQMRVEANISIAKEGAKELGTKVEVKNLNSFRAVQGAIAFEVKRQTEVLEKGESVVQETRGWNEQNQETFSQREKESAHDYRYFPEPDIPPLTFTKAFFEQLRLELPELPQAKKIRLQKEYTLGEKEVNLLVKDRGLGEYFEQVASELATQVTGKELAARILLATNYIVSDLQGLLQNSNVEDDNFKITAENFAELISMLATKKVSTPAAKTLLKKMFETGGDPSQLLESENLAQISENEIEDLAKEIIEKNTKAVEDYKKGKGNALQFLVGQLIGKTKGAADPETARTTFEKLLS